MKTLSAIAALLFLLGAACSSAQQAAPKNEPEPAMSTAQDSGQRMRDDAASLAAWLGDLDTRAVRVVGLRVLAG